MIVKLIFETEIKYYKSNKKLSLARIKKQEQNVQDFLDVNDVIQISEDEAKEIIIKQDKHRWKRKYTKRDTS